MCALKRVSEGLGDKCIPWTRLCQQEEVDVEEADIQEHWNA